MSQEGQENKPDFYKFNTEGMDEYRYSTNVVVTSSNREFFINFICARPYEESKCVSRLVIGEEHMKEIIAVFGRQLEMFLKKKGSDSEGGSRL